MDCLSGIFVLAETSVKKSRTSLTVVLGLVMASKGKGPLFRKGGRGRGAGSESEDFELEETERVVNQKNPDPSTADHLLEYTVTTQFTRQCLQQEQTARH